MPEPLTDEELEIVRDYANYESDEDEPRLILRLLDEHEHRGDLLREARDHESLTTNFRRRVEKEVGCGE